MHCNPKQGSTGVYREIPVMRTGVPCNKNRFFPVRIHLQGVPYKPYRVWVEEFSCYVRLVLLKKEQNH
jgi:hypothetical protein